MGTGQDHRRGPGTAARPRLQRLRCATSEARPAAAGRTVTVDGARLRRWAAGFAERHGGVEVRPGSAGPLLIGGDGERAEMTLPYPPWRPSDAVGALDGALAHLARPRRTLVLLVRRGGYGCAVVDSGGPAGVPGLVRSATTGSRYVQGRTAAGGWSQKRFARRREKQTAELAGAAAEVAARLLVPAVADAPGSELWLATGGDRRLVQTVLDDDRLPALAELARAVHLPVGDARRELVAGLPPMLTAVTITVHPGRQAGRPR